MARRLIINADGFGFTFGNNKGILETLDVGMVKSISTNVNFPAVEEIRKVSKDYPDVSIGIHLCLTAGKPVSHPSEIPSLVDHAGSFFKPSEFKKRLLLQKIRRDDITRELETQVEKLLSMGIRITHWDSHQNQHLNPGFLFPALKVARKYAVERMRTHRHYLLSVNANRSLMVLKFYLGHPHKCIRHGVARYLNMIARQKGIRMADRMLTPGLVDNMSKIHQETWKNLFRTLPKGVSEIYCHPAYPDDELRENASYVEERDIERQLLNDPEVKKFAEHCGVEFISFNDI